MATTNSVERQTLDEAAKQCGHLMSAFRKAKGLRQEDLAERLGVEQGTVSKWERGQRIPRDYWRLKIVKELDDSNGVIFRPIAIAS